MHPKNPVRGSIVPLAVLAVMAAAIDTGCDSSKQAGASEPTVKDTTASPPGASPAPPAPGAAERQATPSAGGRKPNILFIMGDDIGWMQPSIYHRGLMVGEPPNIDRNGRDGAIFMAYVAIQSCTSGRNAFFTGMYPVRTGMIPPQAPGESLVAAARHSGPREGFLLDLGYNTGEFGKNHLGDHTESLPTAHGFQQYWGYLYHLDAMQQVSFPDINKNPTTQSIAPPCKNTPIPGVPEVTPAAVDPKTTTCLTARRLQHPRVRVVGSAR